MDKQIIFYLQAANSILDSKIIEDLSKDTEFLFQICYSWPELMISLSNNSFLNVAGIFVDFPLFFQQGTTASEIVGMISTLRRCFVQSVRMHLGIVIKENCELKIIKNLHELEIDGIVPSSSRFGYENTKEAVEHLVEGKSYWPKDIIEKLTSHANSKSSNKNILLTPRQTQVLSLVCNRGLSNKKIAQALKISESTVKIHMSAILREYGVRNRTQLALVVNSTLKP